MNHWLRSTNIEILVRRLKNAVTLQMYLSVVLLRSIRFIILIDASGFSKFNVTEEKHINNYIQVNFIFIENNDHLLPKRCLQTTGQNINIINTSPLIFKAGNTKMISISKMQLIVNIIKHFIS